jgi:hypothetical protein
MNDTLVRAQVTIRAMKLMVEALEGIGQQMPEDPSLYAILSASPLDLLGRMCAELNDHLTELKQVTAVTAS